ncbi:MAG: NYN domain-containing protein [Phycisphaerales bacterium]|nr:NYN domain-containing protein [Phycisphaerales bacterium]
MPVLVDTYNVLHAAVGTAAELADLDVAELARLIGAGRFARDGVTLVCDGITATGRERISGVDIVYAGAGRDADSVLESLIAESTAPKRLLIVSSDRRIRRAARKRRAKSMPSDVFLRRLTADARAKKHRPKRDPPFVHDIPLDRFSVAWWMEQFGQGTPRDAESGGAGRRSLSPADRLGETLHVPADTPVTPAPASKPILPPGEQIRIDPELASLLRDASIHVDPADLDMRRWLTDRDERPM